MKYLLFTIFTFFIKCHEEDDIMEEEQPKIPQQNTNNIKDLILSILRTKIFVGFEFIENYIIKFHNYIKQDLALEYPLDLLTFILIGITIYYILSKFTKKVLTLSNHSKLTSIIHLMNPIIHIS
jgi:hypothetical protein